MSIKTEDIIKVKKGWYNKVLKKAIKGAENSNIQYIIEIDGNYGVASIKPITEQDINNIDLKKWTFKPFTELAKEWGNESRN